MGNTKDKLDEGRTVLDGIHPLNGKGLLIMGNTKDKLDEGRTVLDGDRSLPIDEQRFDATDYWFSR